MALPTIAINSSGSDTAASGAGPATALSGTAAATAASTTVTLLVDNPDLSGVATDGSAALWVGSSSGRRWSKITGVNNTAGVKTVAVESAYANTESGKSWGIGGKRLSLDGSTRLGLDMLGGWTIDVQTDQVITANFNATPTSVGNVWSTITSTTTPRAVISTSTNSVYGLDIRGANNLVISHLSFFCTAATRGNGIGMSSSGSAASYVVVSDCVIDGFFDGVIDHDAGSNTDVFGMIVEGTEIKNCTSHGINFWAGAAVSGCYCHNNTSSGLSVGNTRTRPVCIVNSIFDSNADHQVNLLVTSQVSVVIRNCNFTNAPSTKHGLAAGTAATTISIDIANCIFYGNASRGLSLAGGNTAAAILRNNAFGSNGTDVGGFSSSTGSSPITLTVNPFVSSSDFTLNGTAGGGGACKGTGTAWLGAATANAPDVGAIQTGGTSNPPPIGRSVAVQNIGTY